jgi:hypothetical protein
MNVLETAWPGGYGLIKSSGGNFYPLPAFLARPAAAMFPKMAVSTFLLFRKTRHYDRSFIEYPMEFESNFFVGEERGHHVT